MAFTVANRNTQIVESLLMGTETHSQKEDGTQLKIKNWTPNNFKMVIICPDYVIVEFYVAPLGKMGTHFMRFPLKSVDADAKRGTTKGILSLLFSGSSRVYSNLEEIYVAVNPKLSADLQDLLNINELGVQPADTGKFREKYPRLQYISYLNFPVDTSGEILYQYLNQTYVKLVESGIQPKGVPIHWYTMFERDMRCYMQAPVLHLSADNCYSYCLRDNFYMLDKKPEGKEDTAAQLYNYFEHLKKLKVQHDLAVKDQQQVYAKKLSVYNTLKQIEGSHICEWLSGYSRLQNFSRMCSPATHSWFNNRIKLVSRAMVSIPKSDTLIEKIRLLSVLDYNLLCQSLGVAVQKSSQIFVKSFNLGLNSVLSATATVANYQKNMFRWLIEYGSSEPCFEDNSVFELSEAEMRQVLKLMYQYAGVEHLSMLCSIMAYCFENDFIERDYAGLLTGVVFDIPAQAVYSLLVSELSGVADGTKIKNFLSVSGVLAEQTTVEFDANLVQTQTVLCQALDNILAGKLNVTDKKDLIREQLSKIVEYRDLFKVLNQLKAIYKQKPNSFQFKRIQPQKLYPSNISSELDNILSVVCTEQNDVILRELGLTGFSLKHLYYLLRGKLPGNTDQTYLEQYFQSFNVFGSAGADFESYAFETDYEKLCEVMPLFVTMLSVYLNYLYVLLMLTVVRKQDAFDDTVVLFKRNSFTLFFASHSFWYTRSLSSNLFSADKWQTWEQNVWDDLTSILNSNGHLINESDMSPARMFVSLATLTDYFDSITQYNNELIF